MDGTHMTSKLEDYLTLNGENEDLENWKRIVGLERPKESELDWYSTRSFEVFLDALDIGQPSVKKSSNNNSTDSIKNSFVKDGSKDLNKKGENNNSPLDSKNHTQPTANTTSHSSAKISDTHKPPRAKTAETILSAEALKILSELPDLSHMSSTRSFIFPSLDRSATTKR